MADAGLLVLLRRSERTGGAGLPARYRVEPDYAAAALDACAHAALRRQNGGSRAGNAGVGGQESGSIQGAGLPWERPVLRGEAGSSEGHPKTSRATFRRVERLY